MSAVLTHPLFVDPPPTPPSAPRSFALSACPAGLRVAVTRIECAQADAERLRSLGLFEGAQIRVIETRNGVVLDVKGSRLALGVKVASAITVCPVRA